MRKPRVIIIDDNLSVLSMLRTFLTKRKFEVLEFAEPTMCPIYEKSADRCTQVGPCADIIITDLKMPRMNGIELLEALSKGDCKLTVKNKAIISSYLDDTNEKRIKDLGCLFFEKPFKLSELSNWLKECENRIDLLQPLASLNKVK